MNTTNNNTAGSFQQFSGFGRVVAEPVVRTTTTGKQVVHVRLGFPSSLTDADGKVRTLYIECEIWNRPKVAGYLPTGREVFITGQLVTDSFVDKGGSSRYVTKLIASDVKLLGSRPARAAAKAASK